MNLESQFNQHLRNILQRHILFLFWVVLAVFPLYSQTQKPNIPDPIRFLTKYDIVANVVRTVLEEMDFSIELENRKGGRTVTRPYEFITGSLTASEVAKYAMTNKMPTGNLLKARYSAEVLLDIVRPTETMVTVRAKIEVLNRNFDGTEKWTSLESLGTIERRILGKISTKLMSTAAPFEEPKGFWNQKPQPVDPRQPRGIPSPPR